MIHTNGGRDDRRAGGYHCTHRRALARMDVGHRSHVMVYERQAADVDQLLQGLRVDVLGVDLYRDPPLLDFHPDRHRWPSAAKNPFIHNRQCGRAFDPRRLIEPIYHDERKIQLAMPPIGV